MYWADFWGWAFVFFFPIYAVGLDWSREEGSGDQTTYTTLYLQQLP
jgi:hypothetical protein